MPMKVFCLSDDSNVHEIPMKNIRDSKIICEYLSGKSVLEVQIVYQSKNRKPYKLIDIYFERISFNSKGVYDVSAALLSPENRIDFE
jgi:hypothetical protein